MCVCICLLTLHVFCCCWCVITSSLTFLIPPRTSRTCSSGIAMPDSSLFRWPDQRCCFWISSTPPTRSCLYRSTRKMWVDYAWHKFSLEIKSTGYNLRKRVHPYSTPFPSKMIEVLWIERVLYKYSVSDTLASVFSDCFLGRNYFITLFYELFYFFSDVFWLYHSAVCQMFNNKGIYIIIYNY